jgi:hypothetical protein
MKQTKLPKRLIALTNLSRKLNTPPNTIATCVAN